MKSAGGVEHQHVEALQLRRLERAPRDLDRLLARHHADEGLRGWFAPTLVADLDRVFIVQSKPNPTLRTGDAAVGTGPYRYVEWAPGRALVLERSASYWGTPRPHFARVTLREIADGGEFVSVAEGLALIGQERIGR